MLFSLIKEHLSENTLPGSLLLIRSNSSAIIKNNVLIANKISGEVYKKGGSSTIQLNHVAFIRNKLPSSLLLIRSNSNAD